MGGGSRACSACLAEPRWLGEGTPVPTCPAAPSLHSRASLVRTHQHRPAGARTREPTRAPCPSLRRSPGTPASWGVSPNLPWTGPPSAGGLHHAVLSAQSCPTLCDPWAVVHQAPLSMGFSRPEYWSGWLCPPPEDLPNPGIKPRSPVLQADSLPSKPPGKPNT